MEKAILMPHKHHKLAKGVNGNVARRQTRITLPPAPWDFGASGLANRAGLVIEDVGEIDPATGNAANPNGVKRARRVEWLGAYFAQRKLTLQQVNAGRHLRACAEGKPTQDALAAIVVDRDPRSGDAAADNYDARREYLRLMSLVPPASRFALEWVAVNDRPVNAIPGCRGGRDATRHFDRLRDGLDAVIRAYDCHRT